MKWIRRILMKNKTSVTLYYLILIIFYIVAIIKFLGFDSSSSVIWLCLGSAFLCFGANNCIKKDEPYDEDMQKKKQTYYINKLEFGGEII